MRYSGCPKCKEWDETCSGMALEIAGLKQDRDSALKRIEELEREKHDLKTCPNCGTPATEEYWESAGPRAVKLEQERDSALKREAEALAREARLRDVLAQTRCALQLLSDRTMARDKNEADNIKQAYIALETAYKALSSTQPASEWLEGVKREERVRIISEVLAAWEDTTTCGAFVSLLENIAARAKEARRGAR